MATSNHEKYLAGVPLNPELAALKAGRLSDFADLITQSAAPAAEPQPAMDPNRELTRDEKIALREMRTGPGWPVLQRLLEKSTITRTQIALTLSQEDPIGRGEELSQLWTTVKLWKALIAELNWAVAIEMQRIEEEYAVEAQSSVEGA